MPRKKAVLVLDCADEPTRLFDVWEGLDPVVVDALRSGAAAGRLHRIDAGDGPLPRDLRLTSTHAMGIADALEIAWALGRAPRPVVVLGLERVPFGMGEEMTLAVAAGLDGLVASVMRELGLEDSCPSAR